VQSISNLLHGRGCTVGRKGIRLIFLNRDEDIAASRLWYGDVNEPRDVGENPGKSSLFFLTVLQGANPSTPDDPGIGSPGDRVRRLGKRLSFGGVRCVFIDP